LKTFRPFFFLDKKETKNQGCKSKAKNRLTEPAPSKLAVRPCFSKLLWLKQCWLLVPRSSRFSLRFIFKADVNSRLSLTE
jgi:hypothetical protein